MEVSIWCDKASEFIFISNPHLCTGLRRRHGAEEEERSPRKIKAG